MSPGNRNSGRKDKDPENKRLMDKLADALAHQEAEKRAKEEGARRIAEKNRGKR